MQNLITYIFLALIALVTIFNLYLNYRQIAAIKNHDSNVPEDFISRISLQEHQKSGQYNITKLKLSNIEILVASVVTVIFTLGGGLNFIEHITSPLTNHYPITQHVAIIICYALISGLIAIPFNIYSTFKIEQNFGFNKTTVGLFITDLIKQTIISLLLGGGLLYLVLWLIFIIGAHWWIWVWLVLVVFNVLMLVIYPTIIAPIFNKFTPLDNKTLEEKINILLTNCQFKSRGLFTMDGSKRSTHGNAYFTGIGSAKRIVFFDTLLSTLTDNEILAVLAHELGHFKKKHIIKQIIMSFIMMLVGLFIANYLVNNGEFYNALGVTSHNIATGLILCSILLGLCSMPITPIISYISRRNEFEADHFSSQHTDKNDLISGLIKLYKDNLATLTPDPWYVNFHYSHPGAITRINHLKSIKK